MRIHGLLLTVFMLLLLTSCGGGDTLIAEGGIGGTGVTQGKVSGFGSLYVNGVKYEIDNAEFIYEEETSAIVGDDSQIKVGMVVRITGSDDGVTGEASTVEYADLLEGPISSKSIASNETGTLVAVGQTVTVDSDTVYDDSILSVSTLLSQLPIGAEIEVSGFSDGNGNILATRVEVKSLSYAGGQVEVKGLVSELDIVPNTFLLGTLIIDYSAISLPDGIADGDYVEAKGTLPSATAVTLEASAVEIEGDGDLAIAEDGEEAELEGIVSDIIDFSPPNVLFILNGQQVLVDAGTEYESGGDASNITTDQPMEAEGIMEGDILVASKIELKVSSDEKEELKAAVDQVNTTDDTFMLLGQAVRVTTSTIFEDERDGDQYFNLDKLVTGDFVEVDLYELDGSFIASKLERVSNEASPDYAEIEGVVDSIESATMITVLNISVDITALTGFNTEQGARVEISGTYDGSILTATPDTSENDD